MNTIRQQGARYLETPHLINNTNTLGQMPFTVKNAIGSGLAFSKQPFLTRIQKRNIGEIELPERNRVKRNNFEQP